MSFLQLVLLLDKTIEGINSILPIVSYRNRNFTELKTIRVLSVLCLINKNSLYLFILRNTLPLLFFQVFTSPVAKGATD